MAPGRGLARDRAQPLWWAWSTPEAVWDWCWGHSSMVWDWERRPHPLSLAAGACGVLGAFPCSCPPQCHPPCVCRTPTSCQRPEARLLQVPERVPSWRVGSASPYPCCPDIPALPCSPALAGHHLTHTLSPAGPLRRSRLSPGGSAAAAAPGLTGANPSSSEPEPRSARTPVTWRAQGTRAPPRTAGRWGGRGAS